MNAPIKDGGPAFPEGERWFTTDDYGAKEEHARGVLRSGMTLRDYFAAKAMHAELLTCGVPGEACEALIEAIDNTGETPEQHMARCAYEMADAMLAAREVQS